MKFKVFLCSCLVAFGVLASTTQNSNSTPVITRTLKLDLENDVDSAKRVLNDFEKSNLKSENDVTTFVGIKTIDKALFSNIDNISASDIQNDDYVVRYKISYDNNRGFVTISAEAVNDDTMIIDTITGNVFVNEKNEIDAVFSIDGEKVYLSELRDAGMLENCGWFANLVKSVVKVVAVTAVAVVSSAVVVATCGAAATAVIAVAAVAGTAACACSATQTIKANCNLSNNKKDSLHSDVSCHGYITNQNLYSDWEFGFDTMNNVGCEVIAVYNTMIALDKKQELYDVIYDFEMLNIDYDIGFGSLGSNPAQIYRYFLKKAFLIEHIEILTILKKQQMR